MFVKPANRTVEGRPLVVRDPDLLDLLPPEGRDVPETMYWQRRLLEGDVVPAQPPALHREPNAVKFVTRADVRADPGVELGDADA